MEYKTYPIYWVGLEVDDFTVFSANVEDVKIRYYDATGEIETPKNLEPKPEMGV